MLKCNAALPLRIRQSSWANFTCIWLIQSRSLSPNLGNHFSLPAFGEGDPGPSRQLWRITTILIAFVNKQKPF